MKIKWKFEEEREGTDEYGNLKPYYKDSEPWKKPGAKSNLFLNILLIILVLVLCGIVTAIATTHQGYDWNQAPGIRVIRGILNQRLGM